MVSVRNVNRCTQGDVYSDDAGVILACNRYSMVCTIRLTVVKGNMPCIETELDLLT